MTWKSKAKQQTENEEDTENNVKSQFFSDTTFKTDMSNSMEWREIYTFFKQGDFSDEYESDVDDLVDTETLQLHKIVGMPTIAPYYDMV